jgi:hypothetical protein
MILLHKKDTELHGVFFNFSVYLCVSSVNLCVTNDYLLTLLRLS